MTRQVLSGRTGSPGVGLGRLLIVRPVTDVVSNGERSIPTGDPGRERARLLAALDKAAADLESLARQVSSRAGEEVGAIFEAQSLFARDPGIVDPALTAVADGVRADRAILTSTDDQAAVLGAVDDEYFRARAADVRDVGRRVAAILSGAVAADLWHADGRPAVIVADDLDPSAVATLRPELVAGIALAGGTPTGHAAIVARGLGVPLVLGLGPALAAAAAAGVDEVDGLVDGHIGRLIIDPLPDDLEQAREGAAVAPASSLPGRRGDVVVTVSANVGSVLEAETAARTGAAGIGLVRTELLFLGRSAPPSVGEQRSTYARIREAFAGRPVVFRTLDVGGDKPALWQADRPEANPALGVRGVRLGLARPALLDDQLTALLEAAGGDEVRVMVPMVATVEEVAAVRARLEAIRIGLRARAAEVPIVRLGVMIEVPSAALVADGLAEVADFFSIGTNDLVQYTLAVDRTNPGLGELATPLQPAVLRLIDRVAQAARSRGRHVAVCGEAAGDPEMIPLLVGLGVEELSVAPGAVEAVLGQVRTLDTAACRDLAVAALAAVTVAEVRRIVASGRGVAVG